MQFYWPLKEVHITQAFGNRSKNYSTGYHFGIDLRAKKRTPIYASAAGKVVIAKNSPPYDGYGAYVIVDHRNGLFSLYAHLDEVSVAVGQNVEIWTQIGLSGGRPQDYGAPAGAYKYKGAFTKAGFSTAYHVHFEIDKNHIGPQYGINPVPLLKVYNAADFAIPEWGKPIVEKSRASGIIMDWTNPHQAVCTEKAEYIFEKIGLRDPKKHRGEVSLLEFAAMLDRLGLFDKKPS